MSERILKALMQLFAIIAPAESNPEERRSVVESFLRQLLNQELIVEYLKVYDEFIEIYQKKESETKKRKSISLSSVKVLKICTAINEELTQRQKIVVLVRLLEFIKADFKEAITEQEHEFVETVSDSFHISREEYEEIKHFIIPDFRSIPSSSEVLLIDKNEKPKIDGIKHLTSLGLQGQIPTEPARGLQNQ